MHGSNATHHSSVVCLVMPTSGKQWIIPSCARTSWRIMRPHFMAHPKSTGSSPAHPLSYLKQAKPEVVQLCVHAHEPALRIYEPHMRHSSLFCREQTMAASFCSSAKLASNAADFSAVLGPGGLLLPMVLCPVGVLSGSAYRQVVHRCHGEHSAHGQTG